MRKEDRLCKYIEHLINTIYLGRIMKHDCKDCDETYTKLIDGFKSIGFRFDYVNPVKFKNIEVPKNV